MNSEYVIYSLEDDVNIARVINLALSKNGYNIQSFYTYKDFLEAFNAKKPNMVFLDLMLLDISGEEILKSLRSDSENDDIEIIIISAKNLTINKIDGLDLGADDYIAKPFDVLELISRVNARSRRYLKKQNDLIRVRNISFNPRTSEVKVGDELIKFTHGEFIIFEKLIKHKGEVVKREDFYDALWGKKESFETRILDVHLKEIRRKLGKENSDLIETIYGVGYKLKNE